MDRVCWKYINMTNGWMNMPAVAIPTTRHTYRCQNGRQYNMTAMNIIVAKSYVDKKQ